MITRLECEANKKIGEEKLNFITRESEAIKKYFKKKIEAVGTHVEELGMPNDIVLLNTPKILIIY